jgi:hypothetical protein
MHSAAVNLPLLLLLQVGVSVTSAAVNRGNQQLLAIRRFAAQVGASCCTLVIICTLLANMSCEWN